MHTVNETFLMNTLITDKESRVTTKNLPKMDILLNNMDTFEPIHNNNQV